MTDQSLYDCGVIKAIRHRLIRKKICFGVFHLPDENNDLRNSIFLNLKKYLASTWVDLNVETIKFESIPQIRSYENSNSFHFSPQGYEYNGEVGWRLGEIGLWAGNIEAWKKLLQSDYEYLVLFEDDVVFEENFVGIVHEIINANKNNWDVISLFVPESEYSHIPSSNSLLMPTFQDWSCLVYAVSRGGAQKLLTALSRAGEISEPIDWWLWRNRPSLRIFALNPWRFHPFDLGHIESTFQQKQTRKPLGNY